MGPYPALMAHDRAPGIRPQSVPQAVDPILAAIKDIPRWIAPCGLATTYLCFPWIPACGFCALGS